MSIRETWTRTCLITAFGVVASSLGLTDVLLAGMVRLENGDVVTGEIVELSDGKLRVKSEHFGEIAIPADQIVDLESSKVLTIEYEDGREIDGYLDVGPDGRLLVRESAPEGTLPRAPVDGLAPAEAVDLAGIDEIHEVTPYYRYAANAELGLNVATGNSDSENVNMAARLVPSFGKNTISLDGQWNRGKADGDLAASNWRINGQYERSFWERWFWLLFNSYEHDRLQDLDLRITAGPGLGYTFFEPDPTLLKVSLGPVFVDENFEGSGDDRQFAALRWTLDFDQDIFSDDFSIYHRHMLTAGLTEDQVLVLTAQGLRFGLIGNLALLLEFQFDHNDKPAGGAKKDDYRYLVKLAYDMKGDENDWWR